MSISLIERPAFFAPRRIGSRNASAVSATNDVPSQPSARSPVSSRPFGARVARYTGMEGLALSEMRSALPSPSGSGIRYVEPEYTTFSPAKARSRMSRYSRSRVSGRANGTPCRPSTTCGPLTPKPRMKRLPDIAARFIAVIAIIDGTRALIWAIPVPRRIRSVCPARYASGVIASPPHASML